MIKKTFLLFLIFSVFLGCSKKNDQNKTSSTSDREPNGGMLRFTLEEKSMHDNYFVAQFTPRGDIFENDNLQLYNYQIGSDKYPQLIISIDHKESDLKTWQGKMFPLEVMALTLGPKTTPLNSSGELFITKVSNNEIEGYFKGKLYHPTSEKTFPITGEFIAMLQINS